jgi:hypothetical protein
VDTEPKLKMSEKITTFVELNFANRKSDGLMARIMPNLDVFDDDPLGASVKILSITSEDPDYKQSEPLLGITMDRVNEQFSVMEKSSFRKTKFIAFINGKEITGVEDFSLENNQTSVAYFNLVNAHDPDVSVPDKIKVFLSITISSLAY